MSDIYLHLFRLFEEKEYGKLMLMVLLFFLMILPGFTYFYIFDQKVFLELEFMKFLVLIILSSVVFLFINAAMFFAILAPRYIKELKIARVKIDLILELHRYYCDIKSSLEKKDDVVAFDMNQISKTMLILDNFDSTKMKNIYSSVKEIVSTKDNTQNVEELSRTDLLSKIDNTIEILKDFVNSTILKKKEAISNLYFEIMSSLCNIEYIIISVCWITYFIFGNEVQSIVIFKIEYLLLLIYFNHLNKRKLKQSEIRKITQTEEVIFNEDLEGLKIHQALFIVLLGLIFVILILYFDDLIINLIRSFFLF